MKKSVIAILLFCAGVAAIAQDRIISGVVTSAGDGAPLAGVAVILEGTSQGTMTSDDGSWSLPVTEGGGTPIYLLRLC